MLLSLCMIVRDEADALPRCLASVQGLVDEIVVVDTGSSDGTPDIARAHGARVEQVPWTGDFAAARNASLGLANGRWILVLDADEELPAAMRPHLQQLLADDSVDGYLVQIVNLVGTVANPSTETSVNLRLFQNRPGYRFSGRLHEQVAENIRRANPAARLVDSGLQILHYGYLDQVVAAKGKRLRNLALARELAAAAPDDPFVRFNLGIELQRQEDYAGAAEEFAVSHARHTPETYWASKLVKSYLLALTALGRWDDALALLEQELSRYPRFTDLYFLKGTVLAARNDHAAALACFQTCLELGPAPVPPYSGVEASLGNCKAAFALGQEQAELGQTEAALASFRAAFAANSAWLEPLRRSGALLLQQRGLAAAREFLEQLLGSGASTQVLISDILCQHQRYDLALAGLEGAAAADAADTATREAALYLRSRCLIKLGRYAEAAAAAALIPEDSPHRQPALVHQVFCLWAEGRQAEARQFMAKHRLGVAFRRQVADLFLEEAQEVLEEGLRRFPEATLLQEALATVRQERTSP